MSILNDRPLLTELLTCRGRVQGLGHYLKAVTLNRSGGQALLSETLGGFGQAHLAEKLNTPGVHDIGLFYGLSLFVEVVGCEVKIPVESCGKTLMLPCKLPCGHTGRHRWRGEAVFEMD